MNLTDREKEQLKALIEAGQPLPPRYKAVLFDQPHEAELIWPGKTQEVTNVVLPFQSIEQIDEPRVGTQAGTTDLFALIRAPAVKPAAGPTNSSGATTSLSSRRLRTARCAARSSRRRPQARLHRPAVRCRRGSLV